MHTAYLVITLLFALMVSYSGIGKIRAIRFRLKWSTKPSASH